MVGQAIKKVFPGFYGKRLRASSKSSIGKRRVRRMRASSGFLRMLAIRMPMTSHR
jgi:hypothetical protein